MSFQVTVKITNYSNVDLTIAEAVLRKLGLKTNQIRMDFISTYGYKDLTLFFKDTVNSPINEKVKASIIGKIKKYGYCLVGFSVDEKLAQDIKEFLAVRENKFPNRAKDGIKQSAVSNINAADGIAKNVGEAANDMDKGAGRTAHGLFNSMTSPVGSERFGEGLRDVRDGLFQFGSGLFKFQIQTPVDAGIMVAGGEIDRFQTFFDIENIGRSLNAVEISLLTSVFGSSINYNEIIIKEGYAGIYNIGKDRDAQGNNTYFNNHRALTRGNTIYMKDNPVGSTTWKSTLVHETTHVWQNQNGGTDYMSEALYAQIFGEGYDYDDAILNKRKTWIMLNPEQQAKLIQNAHDYGYFTNKQWNDPQRNQQQQTALIAYMNNVLPQLRAGLGAT